MTKRVSELSPPEMKSLIKKIIFRFSMVPVVLVLLVLIPAGTLKYWQVYLYITILIVPMIFVLFYFLKNDPLLFFLLAT